MCHAESVVTNTGGDEPRSPRAADELTDESWQQLLATDEAPSPPAFTASFRVGR